MDGILGDLVKEFRHGILTRRGFVLKAGALGLSAAATAALATEVEAQQVRSPGETIGSMIASGGWEVVDMSVTTAHGHPTNWPTDPLFAQIPMAAFGGINASTGYTVAGSAIVNVNRYELTAHTGTQIDFPPHFLPPPGVTIQGVTGNEFGAKTGDQFEMKTLMGPAVVLDVRAVLAANTENGKSAHVTREWVEKWEAKYGQLQPGEVPLLFSGYSDMYYQPFPNGDRFQDRMLWAPLVAKSAPGWAALEPDALNLIADRGVLHLATDGPSFGYTEDGRPPHVAGSQRGMTWGETVVNMGSLPVRGAFYVFAPYKVEKQEAGIGRAFAIRPAGVETVGATEPLVL
jgi:kynurenine formamidase